MTAYLQVDRSRQPLAVTMGMLACSLSLASFVLADFQDDKGATNRAEGRTETPAGPVFGESTLLNSLGETVSKIDKSCWIVFQDKSNNYWFGSDGHGACRYDGRTITRFTTQHGLCNNRIRGIQQHGPSGDILITTLNGVSKFDGQRFTTLNVKVMDSPSPPGENGWVLNADDVWLPFQPGQQGPYRYDGRTLYHLKFPKSPRADAYFAANPEPAWSPYEVYSVYKDRAGHIWFGTSNFGICRFDGQSRDWMYEAHLTELENNAMFGIRSIIEDKDGAFWFCNTQHRYRIAKRSNTDPTDGQIAYAREKGVDLTVVASGESPIYFMSVVEDKRGDLWMATYGDGVWRYDGKTVTRYPVLDGDKAVTVFSIYTDNRDDLWLGTHEAGPYKLIGNTFEQFRPQAQ